MSIGNRYLKICKELSYFHSSLPRDFSDSFNFNQSFEEEGMAAFRIRLSDKLNNFKTLTKSNDEQNVKGGLVRDALMELANCTIMSIMELDMQSEPKVEGEVRYTCDAQFMEDVICLLNHFNSTFGCDENWICMSEEKRREWFNDFAVKHAHEVRYYE